MRGEGRRVKCRGNRRRVRKIAMVGRIKGEGKGRKERSEKNKTRMNESDEEKG